MNITCPNCRARSRIADERVPQNGAWAKCPKCGSRFFIRPPQAEPQPAGGPPEAAADLRQRILNRVRGSAAAEAYASRTPDPGEEPEVFVFPEAAPSPAACVAVGLALLLLPLILIGLFFKSASSWRPEAAPPPARVAVAGEATLGNQVKNDLLWLRDRTIRRRHLLHNVDYTGSESRLFKYYAARLLPNLCGDITHLKMQSDRPAAGFTLTATCLDPRQGRLDMAVAWSGRAAIISFPAYNVQEDVEILPD